MATKYEVTAEPRAAKGTGANRRLRRTGKVPGIVYGAGKDAVPVTFDHNAMLRYLDQEAFHTSILTVTLGGEKDQAILRDYQMHPFKPQVLHIDLQRISATEKIHMSVPLHFLGQDVAPGVKLEGGIIAHLMTEVEITCLPHQLPEFLTIDMSAVQLNESVHLSDIKLPDGVTLTSLVHGGDDLAVATITTIREEEIPVVAPVEGAAVPVEGAAAPGAPGAAVPGAAAAPAAPGAAPGKKPDAAAAGKKPEAAPAGKKPEAKKEGK